MVELATSYLGLDLSSPIVASAGPATGRLDSLQRLADAGVAAVVLPSLFEEEIVAASHHVHALLSQGAGAFGEAETYLPEPAAIVAGGDQVAAQSANVEFVENRSAHEFLAAVVGPYAVEHARRQPRTQRIHEIPILHPAIAAFVDQLFLQILARARFGGAEKQISGGG